MRTRRAAARRIAARGPAAAARRPANVRIAPRVDQARPEWRRRDPADCMRRRSVDQGRSGAHRELAQAAVCRVGSELLTSSSAQSLKCSASFSDICPRADSKHLSKFGFRALVLCVSRATPRCAAMALLRVLASGAAAVAALRVGRPSTRLAGRPASTIATRFTSSLTRSTEQHTSSPVARSSEQRTHSTRSALPRRALLQATAAVSSAAAGAGVALAVPDFLADAPELRPPPGRPPNAPPSGPLANTPLGCRIRAEINGSARRRGWWSRRRRGRDVDILWGRVAATPWPRRGDSVETGRGDAAARDVDIPWRPAHASGTRSEAARGPRRRSERSTRSATRLPRARRRKSRRRSSTDCRGRHLLAARGGDSWHSGRIHHRTSLREPPNTTRRPASK